MRIRAGCYAVVVLLLSACGAGDPHAEITALIGQAEAAAEERDTAFFRRAIAPSYADRGGRDRDELIRLIRGWLFVASDVEVVNRIASVELAGDDAAVVRMQTAIVSRGAGRGLFGIDGELRSIELELVRDGGDWRVIGADWRDADERRR